MTHFCVEGPLTNQACVCVPILRALPAWFGIEQAILEYEKDIQPLPTFLARSEGRIVGFICLKQHYPTSAEVYAMGVMPEVHRQGIGRGLMERAFLWAARKGVVYLQVKTLAPSRENAEYAATRAFYQAMGFQPLEEFKRIWDEKNPCLVMVRKI